MRIVRLVFCSLVMPMLSACGSGDAPNSAPQIFVNLAPDTEALYGRELAFTVTAIDHDGDPLDLVLLNPPAGCEFDPVASGPAAASGELRWWPAAWSGAHEFLFRAADNHGASVVQRVPIESRGASLSYPTTCCDVTGDGTLDLVVASWQADVSGVVDAGAIYVFAGATTPSGSPTAVLTVPGAGQGDLLSYANYGPSLRCCDVTGDGIRDIVAVTLYADEGGVTDQGAIYVWEGGRGLSGPVAPLAVCVPKGTVAGLFGWWDKMQCRDVSGDGVRDIVMPVRIEPTGAAAVFIWFGGSTLTGALPPSATLSVPGATGPNGVGVDGIRCRDVTGDGRLEILAYAQHAKIGGVAGVGAIYVFKGSILGDAIPSATLSVPGAVMDDGMRLASCCDVTADGVLDIIGTAPGADFDGDLDRGAFYVWKGGPALQGSVAPAATLVDPAGLPSDRLGLIGNDALYHLCCDVSGDGVPDLVSGASNSGLDDHGVVYVWHGSASLGGGTAPSAVLRAPFPDPVDRLPAVVHCRDVTGDGILDLLATVPDADDGIVADTGAVYVWAGGITMSGTPAPRATLRVGGAQPGDRLSLYGAVRFCDVTGDGREDIIVPATSADVGGVIDAGAVYVWAAGAGLMGNTPLTAMCVLPAPVNGDTLGYGPGLYINLRCCDVTGDGIEDLVVGCPNRDLGGLTDVGAVYVWAGGSTLTGAPAPMASLTAPGGRQDDRLCEAGPHGLLCCDVTGDGVHDVVVGSHSADLGSRIDVGALYVWAGGPTLVGGIAPDATLTVPGVTA